MHFKTLMSIYISKQHSISNSHVNLFKTLILITSDSATNVHASVAGTRNSRSAHRVLASDGGLNHFPAARPVLDPEAELASQGGVVVQLGDVTPHANRGLCRTLGGGG